MADSTLLVRAVCTMNICRSPAIEFLLSELPLFDADGNRLLAADSQGSAARVGQRRCGVSMELVGAPEQVGVRTSQPLRVGTVANPQLVLAAAADNAAAVLRAAPALRPVTFTLGAAARTSRWLVESGALEIAQRKAEGEKIPRNFREPLTMTEPLPAGRRERLAWLVSEMDACRGLVPRGSEDDDVPDPHVLGEQVHREAIERIRDWVNVWGKSAAHVLASA